MCLIVTKPKGMPLPSRKRLRKWFNAYPDGFGMAFQYQDKVRILKGAMTISEMCQLIAQMKRELGETKIEDIDIVIQYRVAFTGSVVPKYCHPFPITASQEELDGLDVTTDIALAHNGVIWEYNQMQYNYQTDINDAQEFIKDFLVDMGVAVLNPSVQRLIEEYTYSKFALLTNADIVYIGEFIKDSGYYYSNGGYMAPKGLSTKAASTVTSWRASDYTNIPSSYGTGGGIVCEFCQTPSLDAYEMPNDGSLLCAACFVQFEGRMPAEEERYY